MMDGSMGFIPKTASTGRDGSGNGQLAVGN